ncbi:Neprosin activation peptide [Dillenia turbinata]|uniref:Neprosin activation peptide n=1 Tax=Dillenia turbinata TaxID=194707 RepID=A0AAN8UYD7_9MAGN
MVSHDFVEGWSYNRTHHAPHKGTIKNITRPDGNTIDCVDIYQQLAFEHPLLKNHKIQMEPSSMPSGISRPNASLPDQPWHTSGEACPQRTVPIKRTVSSPNLPRKARFHQNLVDEDEHEFATVSHDGPLHGVKGILNVWNPTTMYYGSIAHS